MANKKSGGGGMIKTIILLLCILIIIPLSILAGFYFFNDGFNDQANRIMSSAPGPIGDYFNQFPTPQERVDQYRTIADYYLNIDHERAIDKLSLLASENREVYDDVIKYMLRMNPNATKKILESLRQASLKKDVVTDTLEKIESEQNEDIKSKADYLNHLSLQTAIEEINAMINESVNGHKIVSSYMQAMEPDIAAKFISQLSSVDANKILSFMPDEKAGEIRTTISGQKKRAADLENIAFIYSSKDNEQLVKLLGNTDLYTIAELAKLFSSLGPIKGGQVLAEIANDEFTFEIIDEMRDQEMVDKGTDTITGDMLKSLKIYKEFDDNISEMVTVYEKMDVKKVADLIRRLVRNSSPPKIYELQNGQNIIISDEDMAIELLSRFDNKKVGEILTYLNDTLASEVSRKLTMPEN